MLIYPPTSWKLCRMSSFMGWSQFVRVILIINLWNCILFAFLYPPIWFLHVHVNVVVGLGICGRGFQILLICMFFSYFFLIFCLCFLSFRISCDVSYFLLYLVVISCLWVFLLLGYLLLLYILFYCTVHVACRWTHVGLT